MENHLNSIGNLMLISKSHNSSIGNKPFDKKLETYVETPLLKQQAQIPEFLGEEHKSWTSEQIIKRKEKILDFAFPRWDFNSVDI